MRINRPSRGLLAGVPEECRLLGHWPAYVITSVLRTTGCYDSRKEPEPLIRSQPDSKTLLCGLEYLDSCVANLDLAAGSKRYLTGDWHAIDQRRIDGIANLDRPSATTALNLSVIP
jgi:hypothetical protein